MYTEGIEFEQGDFLFKDLVTPLNLDGSGLVFAAEIEGQLQIGQGCNRLLVKFPDNIPFFKACFFGRTLFTDAGNGKGPLLFLHHDPDLWGRVAFDGVG